MKLIVTGGGTGGHVFPALETARIAQSEGWEVEYFGSLRGQEKEASATAGICFQGFPSEPLYRLSSIKGMRAAFRLAKAIMQVNPALKKAKPDVVFATGGYSSAPILHVAKKLKIPTVLHEQNSVPGRTLLFASKWAVGVCTVFHAADTVFPGAKVVRTGMPVRDIFRRLSPNGGGQVLVVGGSQGSAALNDIALSTALHSEPSGLEWLHVTGKAHFESVWASAQKLGLNSHYQTSAYLAGDEMAKAISDSAVVVARSGAGTISELAVLGVPAVFVPYPTSFGDHQTANAKEIVDAGGGTLLPQPNLTVDALESAIKSWMENPERRAAARKALHEWDVPDATARIMAMINQARA
jgi:UDP-N-acetylglucosamine--N-acetylmuramyl-(pentapeptide) pyrophosphoryl-undecaprenol N-acetylglucosamine transferase